MSELKNNYLELALKTAGIAYWEWNPKENTLEFDKEWFQQIEVLGDDTRLESWMKALHPDDHDLVSLKIKEHLEGKTDFYEVIMRLKTKKGFYRHILAKGKIVEYNKENEPIKFSGVHVDLTELISLKQINQEYKKELEKISAASALNELSSGIAHEVNNPLTIILAHTEVMTKPNLDTQQIKSIESINKGVKRIANIVAGLRDFSSINSFYQEKLNLTSLLDSLVLKYHKVFEENKINFRIQNNTNSEITYSGQKDKIYKVLNNLLSNSIEALEESLESKWIEITIDEDSEKIKISITDSGKINSQEVINKMFHPFYTSKEVGKHLGLGLTTCRGIIKGHGGEIYFKEGDNTCFEFYLPKRSLE